MVHQSKRLALGLESRNHVLRIESAFDHLQRDLALDGFALLGEEDLAHAALADRLDHPVGPDPFR